MYVEYVLTLKDQGDCFMNIFPAVQYMLNIIQYILSNGCVHLRHIKIEK